MKMFVLFAIVLASGSAVASSTRFYQTGWHRAWPSDSICSLGIIEGTTPCAKENYGPLCRVYSSGSLVYASQYGCNFSIQTDLLYQEY